MSNRGGDRLIDAVRPGLQAGGALDLASPTFSVYAFEELRDELARLERARVLLPSVGADLQLLGGDHDRAARNRLSTRYLAASCAQWLARRVEVRHAAAHAIPQGVAVTRGASGEVVSLAQGSFGFDRAGLGLAPGNPYTSILRSENGSEATALASLFDVMWEGTPASAGVGTLLEQMRSLGRYRDPERVYHLMLHHLFSATGGELDEDEVIDAKTGIRDTVVWGKLYKFQRDGVIGAIDKLNRYGGCIVADSVGLGKTFEALAVIKYHELRNDRVLVLCPKRLRDNWTMYTANDRRNLLAADRFNYDVLNHTDLSRESGKSADLDLAHVNWGNYDLVVIDESHNFRNANSPKQDGETRYDRLMRRIIREGVKTRVLMLSATPVNNRLADLRNQIAFATENNDAALASYGIASIAETTRVAQRQFNRWQELEVQRRTPAELVDMLGFDYFALLDLLTIARSRKHIEKYYGTAETGAFPERLAPLNVKSEIDVRGDFGAIGELNDQIRKLNLAAYSPMHYLRPEKRAEYAEKYATRLKSGKGSFQQADREQSLVNLMRVNILKRLESSVHSFRLTVGRQLARIDAQLGTIDRHGTYYQPDPLDEEEHEDLRSDELAIGGGKVRVLIADMDLISWRQDLLEDRERLSAMLDRADYVAPERDAKLAHLKRLIADKVRNPVNPGNRKALVFTAFADTAAYLYEELAAWARDELGVETGLVTGTGSNRTTLKLQRDLPSILSAFSPRSKQRPEDLAGEGELDLLIATDCISEGQNLQDCDWLANYDIHWNPVRIIQRFGRIDRLGSRNDRIQLVNFWPQMDLEEYIGLEQRVTGRMVLLDISATGEENVIETSAGDPMNDLAYRRVQLLKLQDSVLDLEDLSTGVSITDLTLTDLRIDLADYAKRHPGELDAEPFGAHAVAVTDTDGDVTPGLVFCLRAEGRAAERAVQAGDPLAPHYLVHVGDEGVVRLSHTQAKRILDRVRRVSAGQGSVDPRLTAVFDARTRGGADMGAARKALASAVRSITGKEEERAIASLFSLDGTEAVTAGGFAGTNDFEVLAFLAVLPQAEAGPTAAAAHDDREAL
ncbi:helicase-related protein [Kitasatospora phosalacinea]|uniref:helicase-related protein n=1 Tax=Kitasatospora phosalacinea TaxID=2065 RepID=UPI00364BF846